MLSRTITAGWLKRRGACDEAIAVFNAYVKDGAIDVVDLIKLLWGPVLRPKGGQSLSRDRMSSYAEIVLGYFGRCFITWHREWEDSMETSGNEPQRKLDALYKKADLKAVAKLDKLMKGKGYGRRIKAN